jgi:hypothetical protein
MNMILFVDRLGNGDVGGRIGLNLVKLRCDIGLENFKQGSYEHFNFVGAGSNINFKSTSYYHVSVTR